MLSLSILRDAILGSHFWDIIAGRDFRLLSLQIADICAWESAGALSMLSLSISSAREVPGNCECTQSRKDMHLNTENLKPGDSSLWGAFSRLGVLYFWTFIAVD